MTVRRRLTGMLAVVLAAVMVVVVVAYPASAASLTWDNQGSCSQSSATSISCPGSSASSDSWAILYEAAGSAAASVFAQITLSATSGSEGGATNSGVVMVGSSGQLLTWGPSYGGSSWSSQLSEWANVGGFTSTPYSGSGGSTGWYQLAVSGSNVQAETSTTGGTWSVVATVSLSALGGSVAYLGAGIDPHYYPPAQTMTFASYTDSSSTGSTSSTTTAGAGSTTTTSPYTGPTASQEGGFFSTLGGVFTGGLSSVASAISSIGSGIESAVSAIGSGIESAVNTVGGTLTKIANNMVSWIEQAGAYLFIPTSSADGMSAINTAIYSTEPFSDLTDLVTAPVDFLSGIEGGITNPNVDDSLPSLANDALRSTHSPNAIKNIGGNVITQFQTSFLQNSSFLSNIRQMLNWALTLAFCYGVFRTLMGVISKSKD